MRIKNVMLFSYDFPHKKTQDFILRILSEGYNVKYVIAAPFEKLTIPKSKHKFAPSHEGLIHPKKICDLLHIPYFVSKHNSDSTKHILAKNKVDLYIISGARILSEDTIKACYDKVLNIHPGLLPHVRGLDTLQWSIYKDFPLGITAHFISSKIDLGTLIYKEKLILKRNDTIIDVSLRLLEKQPDILIHAINNLKKSIFLKNKNLNISNEKYNTKMPSKLEKNIVQLFPDWINKYSK